MTTDKHLLTEKELDQVTGGARECRWFYSKDHKTITYGIFDVERINETLPDGATHIRESMMLVNDDHHTIAASELNRVTEELLKKYPGIIPHKLEDQ